MITLNWQTVISVYKKGSQTSLSNYRPISFLSVFKKLLEKLMCNRSLKFLEKNNIYFLIINLVLGGAIQLNMPFLELSIKFKEQLMKRNSLAVYFLTSKAFDAINHDILLPVKKLEFCGIPGIARTWFTSYLPNRQQTAFVNNATSIPVIFLVVSLKDRFLVQYSF